MKKMKSLDMTNTHAHLALPGTKLVKNSSSSSQVNIRSSKRTLDPNSRKNSEVHLKKPTTDTPSATRPVTHSLVPTGTLQLVLPMDAVSDGKTSLSQAPSLNQNLSTKDAQRESSQVWMETKRVAKWKGPIDVSDRPKNR